MKATINGINVEGTPEDDKLPFYLNEYNEIQEQIADLTVRGDELLIEIKKYEDHLASLSRKNP